LNWIRGEFLLKSAKIEGSDGRYWVEEEDKNPNFSTHIAPTHKNIYLPKGYYQDTAKGKPRWWVDRYLNGSFEHSEGQVYPIFHEAIVDPFPIPKNWQRIGAADFGLRDPTVLIMGAIDPEEGVIYLYNEYFETSHAVPHHAHNMKQILDEIPYGSLQKLVADPSGKRSNISDNRSIFDHYAEYDIWFQPGDNRIEPGIAKVYAYLQLKKLKVFSSLKNTIREHVNYKYKPQELRNEKNLDEKPIDKDNHSVDSVRYMIQELPDNPKDLIQKSHNPRDFNNKIVQSNLPHQLQTDENPYKIGRNDWYNGY
jgi:phage terminase large subunit